MEIRSELAGSVIQLEVAEGQCVVEGDVLVMIESMKMEIPVEAPCAGTCKLLVAQGQVVAEGDLIAVIS